ncbi:Transmembrane protein [Entamoeba marina]
MASQRLIFDIVSLILLISTFVLVLTPVIILYKTVFERVLFHEDLSAIKQLSVDLTTTKHVALRLNQIIKTFQEPLEIFSIHFCLFFLTTSTHLVYPTLHPYADLLHNYIQSNNIMNYFNSIFAILLSTLIFYGIISSISSLIAHFNPTLREIRRFSRRFGWYFSALQVFVCLVPIVPSSFFNIAMAFIGVPLPQQIFALVQSSLPDLYIRHQLAKELISLDSLKFTADIWYLGVVLFSIGLVLFVVVCFSIYVFFNYQPSLPDIKENELSTNEEVNSDDKENVLDDVNKNEDKDSEDKVKND